MRVIFLGTPEFAVAPLKRLIECPDCDVVAVVTQPDRPAGRGKKLLAPPAKLIALEHGIMVMQPERLSKAPDVVEAMRALHPDVLVSAAFGQILKPAVLEMASMGVVNVHASLLPKYRGAAPINWAIINGETVTGITTMISDVGIDTGPILLQRELPIGPEENAEELAARLSNLGADLLIETLHALSAGSIHPLAQDDRYATLAPRLERSMAIVDWSKPAREIHNLVRGLSPWPGTVTEYDGTPLKIIRTALTDSPLQSPMKPGSIIVQGGKVLFACGDGTELIAVLTVQPANKNKMSAQDWANGLRLGAGASVAK